MMRLSVNFSLLSVVAFLAVSGNTLASDRQPIDMLLRSCPQCHGEGEAAIPGWPPLTALSREELVSKLKTYRDQRVPESRMSDVTHNFTDAEIEQIADHFSRQQ